VRQEDKDKFPPMPAPLRNERQATMRFLRRSDVSLLGDFYEAMPPTAPRFYWPHPLTRENGEKWALEEADSPFCVTLVLETPEGEIAGYAWYRWRGEEAQGSTYGICIRKDYQGCSAGRVLTERLLHIAETVGPPIMRLTCQHANVRAVQLYQKMGFKITKEGMVEARREYPAEPQYWMERRCH
jgi:ribosomal protein S18 acetylase RimI-like enzyme